MKSTLFVADSIQTLADGKNIAIGLYTDRALQLAVDPNAPEPSAEMPFGTLSLGLLFTVLDLDAGAYDIQMSIVGPNGIDYPSGPVPPQTIQVSAARSANVIANLTPFLIPAFGTYAMRLDVKGQGVLEEAFTVRRGTAEDAAAVSALQAKSVTTVVSSQPHSTTAAKSKPRKRTAR
jgi:hypothetical protein